jgi:uncharacterized membrane protein YqiK
VKKEVSSRVVIAVIVIVLIVVIVIAWALFARKPKAAPVQEDTSSPMMGTPMGMQKGLAGEDFGKKGAGKIPEMPQGQQSPQ